MLTPLTRFRNRGLCLIDFGRGKRLGGVEKNDYMESKGEL